MSVYPFKKRKVVIDFVQLFVSILMLKMASTQVIAPDRRRLCHINPMTTNANNKYFSFYYYVLPKGCTINIKDVMKS